MTVKRSLTPSPPYGTITRRCALNHTLNYVEFRAVHPTVHRGVQGTLHPLWCRVGVLR